MFSYALLNYVDGGSIFFILLQILIGVSTVVMLLNRNDTTGAMVIAFCGGALVVYALYLFRDASTLLFVIGLCTLGVGYALNMANIWRQVVLTLGSLLIAWYSLIEGDQIFLWLNVFFALFSGYYAWKENISLLLQALFKET